MTSHDTADGELLCYVSRIYIWSVWSDAALYRISVLYHSTYKHNADSKLLCIKFNSIISCLQHLFLASLQNVHLQNVLFWHDSQSVHQERELKSKGQKRAKWRVESGLERAEWLASAFLLPSFSQFRDSTPLGHFSHGVLGDLCFCHVTDCRYGGKDEG